MPREWSKKDERKYEHVKRSARERGASKERAEEIAARTVNKARREEGRASSEASRGTGNPNEPLEDRTRQELYNLAKERHVDGRSKMTKEELIRALR